VQFAAQCAVQFSMTGAAPRLPALDVRACVQVRVRLDERRIGEILAGIDSASMGPAFVSTAGRLLGHLGDVMTLGFTPLAPPGGWVAEVVGGWVARDVCACIAWRKKGHWVRACGYLVALPTSRPLESTPHVAYAGDDKLANPLPAHRPCCPQTPRRQRGRSRPASTCCSLRAATSAACGPTCRAWALPASSGRHWSTGQHMP
jgi:hypothetical protein